VASITISANAAASRCLRAMTTESFSAISVSLACADPAVSIKRNLAIALDDLVDCVRVVRRPRDDGARSPGELIQQRGLPIVGASMMATLISRSTSGSSAAPAVAQVRRRREAFDSGTTRRISSSNSATPRPVFCRMGFRFLIPRRRNFPLRLRAWGSTLVDCQKYRLPERSSSRAARGPGPQGSLASVDHRRPRRLRRARRGPRNISAGISSLSSGRMPPCRRCGDCVRSS